MTQLDLISKMRRALLVLGVASCACEGDPEVLLAPPPQPAATASVQRSPVDRLAPNELEAGLQSLFGLPVPKGMRIDAHFPDAAHASGRIPVAALVDYLAKRVNAQRVEMKPSGAVFPLAIIKGANADRRYRIEITKGRKKTMMVLRDITPQPAAKGLSQSDRWKQVGLSPDGKWLDPLKLE